MIVMPIETCSSLEICSLTFWVTSGTAEDTTQLRDRQKAQQVKVLTTKADNLSLSPRAHKIGGEN